MKKTEKHSRSGPASDILQLFLILVSIFFLLSLLSFSDKDPSFFTIIKADEPVYYHNLFGKVGAWTAAKLGQYFGWSALLIPFLFAYVSILLHRYRKGLVSFWSPIVGFLYGLGAVVLFSGLSGLAGGKDFYFPAQAAGGVLGVVAATFVASLIGRVGGILVFGSALLALFMLLFSVSFADMGRMFSFAGDRCHKVIKSLFRKKSTGIRQQETENALANTERDADRNTASSVILGDDELNAIKDISFDDRGPEKEPEDKDDYPEENFSAEPEENRMTDEDIRTETDSMEEVEFKERVETEKTRFDDYNLPLKLLAEPDDSTPKDSQTELKAKGETLVQKLKDFGVSGVVRSIQPGPVVTMFEFEPAPGTRVSKISSLDSDLALNMSAVSVRIVAPIPGTNAVGIEMPNKYRATVYIKELFQSPEFVKNSNPLAVALGKDSVGRPYMADIGKMPHLLVAGTTGSGKSVALNVMICSVLYKSSPELVKFIMIDPKAVELSVYDGIPHMLAPVVTDPKLASSVLKNVAAEMDRRYGIFKEAQVRGIDAYNKLAEKDGSAEKLPYVVVIVDEFADLMMIAGKEVETSIIRIAQKARAAGIHLIIATQRPDANVITGLIRSNMPARLGLRVSQKINSRIILDQNGAETLLGRGDSLFLPPGSSDLVRVHGAFVSDDEVRDIVNYLKTLGEPSYDMSMIREEKTDEGFDDEEEDDPEYGRALEIAIEKGTVSISMIQRHLRIGYNKAARIVETMERRGVIAPSDGTAKPREVIVK